MKKFFAVALTVIMLTFCSVSASAYVSPTVDGNQTTSSNTSNTSSKDNSTPTSPKTGTEMNYAVLAVAATLVFGGVAIEAKKKVKD